MPEPPDRHAPFAPRPATANPSPLQPAGATAPTPATANRAELDAFLKKVEALAPARAAGERGRLVFALDATMSRQPTWDMACRIQSEMFSAVGGPGGLEVQLVYYRGLGECRASRFVSDAAELGRLMGRIDCRGGETQIGRVLTHTAERAAENRVHALVFVGDAFEEQIDRVAALAGQLAVRGVPAFMFQEGHDPLTEKAFREIARLTGGAWCRFDAGAASELASLLRAVAVYATGGRKALTARSHTDRGAQLLLTAMGQGRR
jgi:hypothetical protein